MIKGQTRFDSNWDSRSKLQSYLVLLFWFLRGSTRKFFFKSSKGLVLIARRVHIRSAHKLVVGKNFVVEPGVELNCNASEGMHFGDGVTIGTKAVIRPSNIYGGDIGDGLSIGNNSNIGPYAYIGCSGKIEIGNNVMMGPRVDLFAENHNYDSTEVPMREQGVSRSKIVIEDDCWIASNVTILAGVTIGKGSIIAAGSIVNKDVPPYVVMGGNPAKILKSRKPQ